MNKNEVKKGIQNKSILQHIGIGAVIGLVIAIIVAGIFSAIAVKGKINLDSMSAYSAVAFLFGGFGAGTYSSKKCKESRLPAALASAGVLFVLRVLITLFSRVGEIFCVETLLVLLACALGGFIGTLLNGRVKKKKRR